MKKTLILGGLLICLNSFAVSESFLEFGNENYEAGKGYWKSQFGANYIEYPVAYPDFNGTHESFKSGELQDMYGLTFGFGREMAIGAGISTSLGVNGFYHKTVNSATGKASEEVDIDLSDLRKDNMIYGAEVEASINYMFETSILNVQPFIGAGVGVGQASFESEYNFDGVPTSDANREYYKALVEDSFAYNKLTVGLNLISKQGIVTYFKMSRTSLGVSERSITSSTKVANGSVVSNPKTTTKNMKEETQVTTGAIGIGFLF